MRLCAFHTLNCLAGFRPLTFSTTAAHRYYGERTGNKTDEEYKAEKGIVEVSEDEFLKEDAVLVVGGTGRTGQWVTLGLLNQGFNVRVLTRSFGRAEKLFGPSGSNVDVFQGDVLKPETLRDAVDGAIGVVFAAGGEWWRGGGVEGEGAKAVIEEAGRSGSVARIVLLSARERRGKREVAEEALRASGIPFVILRMAQLGDGPGGMKTVVLKQDGDGKTGGKGLTRVDAAQVVCQTLVHDKFVASMWEADPEGGFEFGNCVVEASNGDEAAVADKRFWKRAFAGLETE